MKKKELADRFNRLASDLEECREWWCEQFSKLLTNSREEFEDFADEMKNAKGPDQAEFNRFKTSVSKLFDRRAAELRALFDKHDASMIGKLNNLNGIQDQLTGFEKFITDKVDKLSGQLVANSEANVKLKEENVELKKQIGFLAEDCKENSKLSMVRSEEAYAYKDLAEQLKQELFNLSENFDCLNNTVNEIMKREAIRDRGIKIPCPSTDEYDKLMEQWENPTPAVTAWTWTEFKRSQDESQQHYFETMQKVREEVACYPESKKEGVVTEVPKNPSVEIVVATDLNGVIGVDGKIPWDCPEDRKLFKELTTGHVVVMGRKTYDSLPEQFKQSGLPGRTNIIMSRDSEYASRMNKQTGWSNNSIVFSINDPEGIMTYWKEEANGKFFIIGGEEIYKLWMPFVDVIHHSRIETEINTELASSVAKFEFVDADWGCLVHEVRKGFTYSKLLAMPGCEEA